LLDCYWRSRCNFFRTTLDQAGTPWTSSRIFRDHMVLKRCGADPRSLRRGILQRPPFTMAVGILSEVGDLSRFDHPRQLMAWMGVTRPEHSSGDKQRRRSIEKTGNSYARQLLVEAAWSYRYPACGSPRSSAGTRASRRSSLIAPGTRRLDHVGAIAFMVSRWFQGI
jgi:hypothetical protein